MTNVCKVVLGYRKAQGSGEKPLPLRDFARELSAPLIPLQLGVTFQAVSKWEKGKAIPKSEFLHVLTVMAAPFSWQWQFAQDLKAAIFPEVHEPVGEVGKRVLAPERGQV